ncbi:hypothetical protein CFE53_04365 [Methanofervidicoccus sp. A16]|uniref:hypothetical protein n=1 Tax=Methanofervidicoccus sp. A16 TaxID=2607662 RepID=UPI00118B876D|nr:hypothetical protein [Methanofervidicoccus sp. A16]AXI25404.1 hypothetical protein CFE53_04365 [Methanofervidicoccus sp. A16]
MIFDSDILIGVIILIVGMGFFTLSMVEHTDSYVDAVRTNILYDKASAQLKSLVSDGTLESAILLINNGYESMAKEVLENRIDVDNYVLTIGNYTISEGNLNNIDTVIVSTVIVINRTEGWYGIYGDSNSLNITEKHFLSEEETYNYLNQHNYNYPYKRAIYYFRSNRPINITLICGG